MPNRNTYHSRGDPEEHWKKLVSLEKNCEFKDIKQEDLLLSKIITSITDKKLGAKFIRKKTLNFKTTMDLVTQDCYEKRHSPESTIPTALVKEKEIKQEPIQKIHKNYQPNRSTYTGTPTKKKNGCGFCRQQNWTSLHKCPAKTVECNLCHKLGHFATVCHINTEKTRNRVNYIEETFDNEEEDSEPEAIRQITQIN